MDYPLSTGALYAAAGARLRASLPIGSRLALLGDADFTAVITRPTFQLNERDVWRPSVAAVSTLLGVSVRIN